MLRLVFRRRRCWLFVVSLLVGLTASALAAETLPPKVGVLTDNYPFSFRAENGELAGFAHDILSEVERVMGLRFERVTGSTAEINEAFADGRLAMLQSFASAPERETMAEFSFPYLTMEGAIFVRRDERRVTTLADLRGRKVGVHRGSLGERLLQQAGLGESIVLVPSVAESLRRLDRGEIDATLATRLSGLAQAKHLGLKEVRALPAEVPGYEVRYCIAVQPGEHRLLARVNEGLAVLVRTGRFDELYRKWFAGVTPRGYSEKEVILGVAVGLALALIVAVFGSIRERSLRLRIARQAEQLRESEERHRAVFEGAHDGLIVLGPADAKGDFPIEQVNPAARRLLKLAGELPAGATLRGVLPEEVALHGLVVAALARRGLVDGEHECAGRTGWWRVVVSPLGSRTLLALADITEATETRLRLKRQEAQLRQTQKLEAIGTLAGGIAHDFNNLLTAIIGNTELTLMALPKGRPECAQLQLVLQASGRARQLVRQILTFSRRSEPHRELLAVEPIIEETVNFLQTVARGAVTFEQVKAAWLPDIVADAAQVHQVLMNLGTNAVQAMRGTPGVLEIVEEVVVVGEEVQAQHPTLKLGRYVRIGFRDTGPGMTDAVRERIFEPFFTTKPLGEGSGLGLSVVHGIVEQHGGTVTVYSQPGRGSLFHVYFPVASEDEIDAGQREPGEVPRGNGEQVLLVDDDAAIVKTAEQILTRLGYRVTAHGRPEAALADLAARSAEFAVVVSDLTMPGCTGLELAARVRELRPGLAVILASGFFSADEEAEAEALSITQRLHKPLTYAALGRAVARCLGKGSNPPFAEG